MSWVRVMHPCQVGVIGGNHEAYGDSLFASIADARRKAERASANRVAPVRYLERETWVSRSTDGTPIRVIRSDPLDGFCALRGESTLRRNGFGLLRYERLFAHQDSRSDGSYHAKDSARRHLQYSSGSEKLLIGGALDAFRWHYNRDDASRTVVSQCARGVVPRQSYALLRFFPRRFD